MSPITLGFWATAGASASAAGAYEHIETLTPTSSTTTTFSAIPSTYKHLQVRASVMFANNSGLSMRMNGITTASYSYHDMRGNGSVPSSSGTTGQTAMNFGGATAMEYAAPFIIDILDYANTTKNKTVRVLYGNAVQNWVGLASGLLISTNAITSLTFFQSTYNFTAPSRLSLYGVKG